MTVCHCLFWIKDNKVTSVLAQKDSIEIMKFGGNETIEYTEDFWNTWKEYSGFTKSTMTDFCLVFDEQITVPKDLTDKPCAPEDCIWNSRRIQKVVEMLGIQSTTRILDKEERCVAHVGSFRNIEKDGVLTMFVDYQYSLQEDDSIEEQAEESAPVEMTPFIQDMLHKLAKYDRE